MIQFERAHDRPTLHVSFKMDPVDTAKQTVEPDPVGQVINSRYQDPASAMASILISESARVDTSQRPGITTTTPTPTLSPLRAHQKLRPSLSSTCNLPEATPPPTPPTILQQIICAPCNTVRFLHKTKTSSPLLEILFYIIFLASIVMYSVDLGNNSQNYWFTSRVEELLAKEEWGVPVKTYMEIMEREEWWEFIQGKFHDSLFDNYDGLPLHSKQRRAKLWDGNFVFHSIRFNQVRVNTYALGTEDCQIPPWLSEDPDMTEAIVDRGCRPPFTLDAWSTSDFEPLNNTKTARFESTIGSCFQYNTDTGSAASWPFTGNVYSAIYPINGHSCRINATVQGVETAQQWLKDLKRSGWFDSSTRLVTIDFTLYSADVNMFVYARLIAEQAATGGLVTYFDTGGIKLATGIYP